MGVLDVTNSQNGCDCIFLIGGLADSGHQVVLEVCRKALLHGDVVLRDQLVVLEDVGSVANEVGQSLDWVSGTSNIQVTAVSLSIGLFGDGGPDIAGSNILDEHGLASLLVDWKGIIDYDFSPFSSDVDVDTVHTSLGGVAGVEDSLDKTFFLGQTGKSRGQVLVLEGSSLHLGGKLRGEQRGVLSSGNF